MNPYKRGLLCLALLMSFTASSAQDLTQDWDFLHQARSQYERWLEGTELKKVLRVHDLQIFPELVLLDLRIPNGNDWISFKERYEAKYGTDLRRKLFQQMLFMFQLEQAQAGLRIRSDQNNHYVDMRYRADTLAINETNPKSSRIDSIRIDFSKIPGAVIGDGAANLALTRSKLRQFFAEYYREKSTRFREVKYDIFDEEPLQLSFIIWNLKKEILNDLVLGYYERILLDLTFKTEGQSIKIYYEVYGSYGSGIFRAPRKTEYTDIDLDSKSTYMDEYKRKIKSRINQFMKKRP